MGAFIFLSHRKTIAKKGLQFLLVFIPFAVGMYGPLNLTGIHLERMPGDLGDSRLINYILEHGYQFLSGNTSGFYDAPYFYPAKNVIALSDNMIGSLPIYSFFRIQGFNRETAFQLWWLSVFAFNYFISFWCFKKFSGNFYAAVIAAWLFTFSMPNFVHYSFVQVNSKYFLPLILLCFLDWLKSGALKSFYLLLIFFFLQLLTSVYFSIFAVVFVVILSLVHLLVNRTLDPFKPFFASPIAYKKPWLALLLTAAASVLFLYPSMATMGDVVRFRSFEAYQGLVPMKESFMSASIVSHWADVIGIGDKKFPDSWWYHAFFPGMFIIIILLLTPLFLVVKFKKISKQVGVILVSFCILFCISIRWNDHYSPLKHLYDIGLFGPISFASRILLPLELLLLFYVAYFLSAIFGTSKKAIQVFVMAGIVVLIAWDHLPTGSKISGLPKSTLYARYEKILNEIKKQDHTQAKTLVILNSNNGAGGFIQDAMMVSQSLRLNCINGYSSNAPSPSAADFWGNPTQQGLENYCKANNLDRGSMIAIENPN